MISLDLILIGNVYLRQQKYFLLRFTSEFNEANI